MKIRKQANLSHLVHRKPAPIHWKVDAPKTSHCLVWILVQRHNWAIFLIGPCWRNFCVSWQTATLHTYIDIIGHYNPLVRIIGLVSHITYLVCVNFISKWRDIQFKVDCERQIFLGNFPWQFLFNLFYTLRVFARNLLRERERDCNTGVAKSRNIKGNPCINYIAWFSLLFTKEMHARLYWISIEVPAIK